MFASIQKGACINDRPKTGVGGGKRQQRNLFSVHFEAVGRSLLT